MVLVLLAYSNTFSAAWHLDDITNILDNKRVQIARLTTESLLNSLRPPFSGSGTPAFYRPVAMITFALNWYFGKANVIGYHLVNIGIHFLNAWILFVTIINLLRSPRLKSGYHDNGLVIALAAAAVWALHPIQTQAVTYIVQRMASLATLFFLFGIYCYIKGRLSQDGYHRYLLYILCIVSYGLALGTKQNTVVLPAVLFSIEYLFFLNPHAQRSRRDRWRMIAAGVGLAAFLLILFLFWMGNPVSAILSGYKGRAFTFSERILTEFRVLVFYLGQIFYPIPQKFSILHEVTVSKSLLNPRTTLPAIFIIGSLFIFALLKWRRYPLISFAILFFFIGHAVESTVWPLELIFEHRNYLPTLFMFLPLAAGLHHLISRYQSENRLVYSFLIAFLPLIILGLVTASFTRNMVWASPKSLWMDAMQKAPSMARPYQNVAMALESENRLDSALALYERSLDLGDPNPKLSRFISLGNMGNIYKKKGDYDMAVNVLKAAMTSPQGPYILRVHYNLVLCMLNTNQAEAAFEHINQLLAKQPNNRQFIVTKGFLLQQRGYIDAARRHFQMALKQNAADIRALYHMGMALSAAGEHRIADRFLLRARNRSPRNLNIYLGLVQNAISMHNPERISVYLSQITNRFKLVEIESFFAQRAKGYQLIAGMLIQLNDDLIMSYLASHLEETAHNLGAPFSGDGKMDPNG